MTSLILVVDDSHMLRRILTMNLEQNGFQVIEAEDGEEALQILNQQKIDFVFVDIHMPKVNGLHFLKTVRQHKTREELPVAILTALCDDNEQLIAEVLGANEFLTKPVSTYRLLETIEKHLALVPSLS